MRGPVVLVGFVDGWLADAARRRSTGRSARRNGRYHRGAGLHRLGHVRRAYQAACSKAGETVFEDNPYGPDPTPTHPGFYADAKTLERLGSEASRSTPRCVSCTVSAIPTFRGMSALRLAQRLRSDDVQVALVKDGDHRLSRPQDIALLMRTVACAPRTPDL